MSEVTSIHPEPRQPAPVPGSRERERKRRRKALSCYDCRRRKLRCDRAWPSCSRCSKAGLASSCRYETDPLKNGQEDSVTDDEDELRHHNHTSNIDGTTFSTTRRIASIEGPSSWAQSQKISQLENRIANIEAVASQPSNGFRNQVLGTRYLASPKTQIGVSSKREPETVIGFEAPESMIFRKGSFETQYYGATNDTAQVAHFPEFFNFFKDKTTDRSSMVRVRADMLVLKRKRKIERANNLAKIDGDLLSLMPSREEADYLVRLYFDNIETTYRIIHQPTFWEEYRIFWVNPKSNLGFLALILLTMAIVRCMTVKETMKYVGDSTKEREKAILHISACDIWLRSQSIKHTTIQSFQVHCLLILAKLTNLMKLKQAWTITGTALRFFMSAGMHRDPDSVWGGKISEFHKEMRRRLWATMAELELEASVMRGMPTALAGLRTDGGSPRNINDHDFDDTSVRMPNPKPSDEYTSTSFLCFAEKSLSLRIALVSEVNSSNQQLPYEDVLIYEEKIMQQLHVIPRWSEKTATIPSSALMEALLDIQLRQFLIILHSPYARSTGSNGKYNSQYSYSRTVCFDAASSIIQQHFQFTEAGNHMLSVLRNDVYRAAMCICQNIFMSSHIPDNPSGRILTDLSVELAKRALDMLEQRATLLGRGYIYFAFASAAYGVTLSNTTDIPLAVLRQQAVNRVVSVFQKVAGNQSEAFQPFLISDDLQSPPQSNASVYDGTSTEGQASIGTPFFKMPGSTSGNQGMDNSFFDYNLPGWNMEDFWAFDINTQENSVFNN